ncbi:hypothetical protein PRK78_002991 [Emydomyces testavorans]|uniref:UBX domain-containing protein n=1 Tax=Emydomyces testavorans TaxID=2070801 RepID=A0AAF0IK60_9EURO|nr:hypothetical protein PRK78_002991 [Emydomyces testavorans]
MFYRGDLQSGIALAVQEAKQVICFVRDDGEESARWENEYLADEELLSSSSVALRLSAGSQEAEFLASFCPINKTPTLVAIKNGVLQEYIVSGTTEDALKRRLKAILTPAEVPRPQQLSQIPQTSSPAIPQPSIPLSEPHNTNIPTSEPEQSEEEITAELAKRESIRQGKRRALSPEPAPQQQDPAKDTQKIWRQQQLNRERHEREERERVLALIRHDKEERKAKAEQQRLSHASQNHSQDFQKHDKPIRDKSKVSEYRLQIRLFDGSSIRSNFAPTQTIRNDVRPWIDGQRTDGNTPYTLKQILTPLPNKSISISEEDHSLSELGLGPTANLVMIPVHNYTEAYAASESSLPIRGLYAGYNLVAGTVGTVAGALGSFLGLGQGQAVPQSAAAPGRSIPAADPAPATAGGENIGRNARVSRSNNVRTLYDQHPEQGDQQFYNGNQLNFEPRKNQDKED